MITKICTTCLLPKILNDFHVFKHGKYGKHSRCKHCTKLHLPSSRKSIPGKLSREQKEIFIGSMLGDGSLYKPIKNSYNSYFRVLRSARDKIYLQWQADKFANFCKINSVESGSYFDKRTNKRYFNCKFRTRASSLFTSLRKKWYSKGIKIIPKDLKLTPLIVAVWFCDDGCISTSTNHNGKKYLRCTFATDGFSKNEVNRLRILLEKFVGKKFSISKHEGNYIICSGQETCIALFKKINKFLPKGMERKTHLLSFSRSVIETPSSSATTEERPAL